MVLNNNFNKLKLEYQEQLFNKETVINNLQKDIEIKVQEINLLENSNVITSCSSPDTYTVCGVLSIS